MHGAPPDDALPDWELLPAPRGSGYWLCAATATKTLAVAAPGVALEAGSGREDLSRWRCGSWPMAAADGSDEPEYIDLAPPTEILHVTLREVAKLVGPEWEPWLLKVTNTLIRRTIAFGFARGPGRTVKEERARRSRAVLDQLLADAATLLGEPAASR